ncbi:MAG: hypothetical protein ACTSYE_05445, partial [Alphaproteobacteria bacterium]
HAWRKATKRLYFLLEPARGQLPSAVRSHIRRIDDLGELLGLDHDHALLARRLKRAPEETGRKKKPERIAARRRALQREAFKLGQRVYGRTPRDFRRRTRLARVR